MINIILGGLSAVCCIGLIQYLFPKKIAFVWSLSVIVAALIYVGFAVNGAAWDFLSMEFGGVLIYSIFACLAIKYSPYWLALAWALHMGWDVFLHDPITTPYVPVWYPAACLGFDIVIVFYVLGRQFLGRSSIKE